MKSASKINELLMVLWFQCNIIGLKVNVKEAKSLRLGISDDEKVTLGNKKIAQVDVFTYLGVLLVKIMGAVKMSHVE